MSHEPALAKIAALTPAIAANEVAFDTAADAEVDAEIAILDEALALAAPAMEAITGWIEDAGVRGMYVIPSVILSSDGAFYERLEGVWQVVGADTVVGGKKSLLSATLEAMATRMEAVSGGDLPARTAGILERGEKLRLVLALLRKANKPTPKKAGRACWDTAGLTSAMDALADRRGVLQRAAVNCREQGEGAMADYLAMAYSEAATILEVWRQALDTAEKWNQRK